MHLLAIEKIVLFKLSASRVIQHGASVLHSISILSAMMVSSLHGARKHRPIRAVGTTSARTIVTLQTYRLTGESA